MNDLIPSLMIVWLFTALLMSGLWLVQRRTGNAGIVDVGWAFSLGLSAIFLALWMDGDAVRRCLVAGMGGLWGFRLAWHIHHRSHGKPEDGRYQQLRKDWGAQTEPRMFRFYQFQALSVGLLALPFALAAGDYAPWRWIDGAALVLWVLAWSGETWADAQLAAFKKSNHPPGTVFRSGLWNYSRHPNYFFEWLNWCAFALIALPAPAGWIAILAPASILYLLLRVTGIPATEEQAVRSKGEAYRDYQRTTSAFVPWFPKGS